VDAIIPEGFDDLQASDLNGVIDEMVQLLVKAGKIPPENEGPVVQALKHREQLGSTAVTKGVAIPHVRHDSVQQLVCALGRSKRGVNYEAEDRKHTHLFFLVLSSKAAAAEHLERLVQISHAIRDDKKMLEMMCEQDCKKLEQMLKEL
jgi:PTS system fructose-specific IIA component/PTS system nitrogen regulatory IIA component